MLNHPFGVIRERSGMAEHDCDLPEVIFAYKSTKALGEDMEWRDVGYHGTGTWIDFDDSTEEDKATKYVKDETAQRYKQQRDYCEQFNTILCSFLVATWALILIILICYEVL